MKPAYFCLSVALLMACQQKSDGVRTAVLPTVTGDVPVDSLGRALIHEHVFLDWSGADSLQPAHWANEEAFLSILPYLKQLTAHRVNVFFDCTPNYLGRNPALLRRLSEQSGLLLVTNTGYYGAANDKYVPKHAFLESADQLAERWTLEFRQGIDSTGIKPGFIKIGVDPDSVLSDIDQKLVRAAARTHLETGLTIVSHTGPDQPALQQLSILEEEGVSPSAWVWTHAQNGTTAVHVEAARKGAWISLDGLAWVDPVNGDSTALRKYVTSITELKNHGLLDRVLISHDGGWYSHGEPKGGSYKPHTLIFDLLLPELKKQGLTAEDFDKLLIKNPANAYSPAIRKRQ